MSKRGLVPSGIFVVLGLAMIAAALFLAGADRERAAKGGRAEGTVIDLRNQGSNRYSPIVAFQDDAGQRRVFVSTMQGNPPAYARGERVSVIYDPANPADATIDSVLDRYFGSLIIGFIGSLFFLIGGGALFFMSRRSAVQRYRGPRA